jgi:hypothetical protein
MSKGAACLSTKNVGFGPLSSETGHSAPGQTFAFAFGGFAPMRLIPANAAILECVR